jgi:hypothetical protein
MLSLRNLAAAASVAALAALPLAASALETNAPVAVTSCDAQTQAAVSSVPFVTPSFADGNVHLSFTNTSAVPATNVEFLLSYNGTQQRVDTAGTFSQGTRIDKDAAIAPFVGAGDVTCRVAKVDFSDGTSWNALAAAPQHTALR